MHSAIRETVYESANRMAIRNPHTLHKLQSEVKEWITHTSFSISWDFRVYSTAATLQPSVMAEGSYNESKVHDWIHAWPIYVYEYNKSY